MVKINKIFLCFFLFCISCSINETQKETEGNQIVFNEALGLYNDMKYMRAKDLFNEIIYNNPLSQYSNDAQFYIAECDYYLDDFEQAAVEYTKYLRNIYKRAAFAEKSEIMLCRCYYNLSLEFNKDQSNTLFGLEKLQYYIEKESMSKHIEEISGMIEKLRLKLAKREFETAKLYLRLEQHGSAQLYFKNVLNEFYDTKYYDYAIMNLVLFELFNYDKSRALVLLEKYKNDFINSENYDEIIFLLESIKQKQKMNYYIKLMK